MEAVLAHAADSDESLMCAYRDGDTVAFDELYRRHKGPLYRFVLRNTGDAAVAAELYQDVWLRVVRARASYRPEAAFRTWLFTLAHNRLGDHYRTRARREARIAPQGLAHDEAADEAPLPPEHAQNAQLQQALLRSIVALPPAQREAFLLKEEAGLSLEQIAAVVGTSRETVKSRLRYAVNKLRAALRSEL